MADINSILSGGFGQLGNALFPVDPNSGVDPASAAAAQRQAVTLLGLGLLAGKHQQGGFGSAALNSFQGASQNYQGAMQSAFHNTLLKRQADYQQQDRDRQAKLQQQQDRQNAAVTAQRVSAALSSPQYAQNPSAYLSTVQGDPAFRQMLQDSGLSLPQPQQINQNGAITQQPVTPEQYQQFARQLGQFGQLDAAPTAPRDLNLKAVIDPKTGKPTLIPEAQAIGLTPYDKPSTALKAVVGPDGKPTYVPADQATGMTPYYKADVNVSSGKLSDWTPEALDFATENLYRTGKTPPGLGKGSPVLAELYARAAARAKADGRDASAAIFGQQAYKAGSTALSALTKQQTMVGAFEKTAQKNMDLVLQLSSQVDRTGSPLVNRAIMAFQKGVTGDPDTKAFVNALVAARTEYAKVLSGATGSQGVTDSARREAEELFSTVDGPEALQRVIATAKQEMANRMSSFDEQQAQLRDSMSSGGLRPASPAPAAAAPSQSAAPARIQSDADYARLPSGAQYIGPDGQLRQKR